MEICKQCKKNFELEKEVRFFDQRIALLINHKITVEVMINIFFLMSTFSSENLLYDYELGIEYFEMFFIVHISGISR